MTKIAQFSQSWWMLALFGVALAWGTYREIGIRTRPVYAQSFEVASVRAALPMDTSVPLVREKVDGQQATFRYASLQFLIIRAWGVRAYQIVGPDWLATERYDIVAKMPTAADRVRLPALLQVLLNERFRLQAHYEERERKSYALIVSDTAKLEKARHVPAETLVSRGVNMGAGKLRARRQTLAGLAGYLSSILSQPVVDVGGIDGEYDIVLDVAPREASTSIAASFFPASPDPLAADPGGSIFTSLQKYGLRLTSRRLPIKHLVIDRLEKVPTEN